MPKRWFVYNMYPAGRGVSSTHDALNKVRVILEEKLRKHARPYKWFTLLVNSQGVKFGVKIEDPAPLKDLIQTKLKKEYTDLVVGLGDEDPDNCEIMAIATQCRTKIEDKIPLSKWKAGEIGFIVHCLLNPYGYDNEAWSYWTSLSCIDEDVAITDPDIKDVILLARLFLEYKKGMEIEDNYEKVEHILKELDSFTDYLKKKTA